MVDIFDVKGTTGRIIFDGEQVTILRGGRLGRSAPGAAQLRLPITEILAVDWHPAGLTRGSIMFQTERTRGLARFGRDAAKEAARENTVAFRAGQQPEFAELKVAVERALAAGRGDTAPVESAATTAEEIARLSHLVQSGAITQQEFRQAKNRLLGGQGM
ncbi:DUF4429 domain-containing protein [Streptomyces sp. SID4948]|nr:DUF4429 domain-containing protein [Streptomyces sp. SID4948]MYS23124.1 DUF4429 domain-containing protein [Streptomyces sp. SID4948]